LVTQLPKSNPTKARELFEREAKRLYELSHPQIPKLYAFFEQDNALYLVEEYIQGRDLFAEYSQGGSFDETKIIVILQDLLPVLSYLHKNKVLHRDIKPQNIMRRYEDGKLLLIDFGGAKVLSETVANAQGTVIYTPGYAAPEHMAGRPTTASDIYSLGVTCIRLLTGCFFATDEHSDTVDRLYDDYLGRWIWREQLLIQKKLMSEALAKILDKMIQPLPKDRYFSAKDILDDLYTTVLVESIIPPELEDRLPPTSLDHTGFAPVPKKYNLTRAKFLRLLGLGGIGVIGAIAINSIWRKPTKSLQPSWLKEESLKLISFDVITVNDQGEEINHIRKQVKYLSLDLGNGIEMDLMLIPQGTFLMGSPATEKDRDNDEEPIREVTMSSFFIGKYPVTQAQWEAIMGNNPSFFRGAKRPVESISWHDCTQFCQKLSQKVGAKCRLPSEAEWEYACRGQTTTPFHFGETITTDLANYNGRYPYLEEAEGIFREQTTDVGLFLANAFGLYDLHGNVFEWCADTWHENYNGAPKDGQPWIDRRSDNHILRGGSWNVFSRLCRSAYREYLPSNNRDPSNGFRLAISA
jgi:formylglycine-generating enzyme required for sulfatase activity